MDCPQQLLQASTACLNCGKKTVPPHAAWECTEPEVDGEVRLMRLFGQHPKLIRAWHEQFFEIPEEKKNLVYPEGIGGGFRYPHGQGPESGGTAKKSGNNLLSGGIGQAIGTSDSASKPLNPEEIDGLAAETIRRVMDDMERRKFHLNVTRQNHEEFADLESSERNKSSKATVDLKKIRKGLEAEALFEQDLRSAERYEKKVETVQKRQLEAADSLVKTIREKKKRGGNKKKVEETKPEAAEETNKDRNLQERKTGGDKKRDKSLPRALAANPDDNVIFMKDDSDSLCVLEDPNEDADEKRHDLFGYPIKKEKSSSQSYMVDQLSLTRENIALLFGNAGEADHDSQLDSHNWGHKGIGKGGLGGKGVEGKDSKGEGKSRPPDPGSLQYNFSNKLTTKIDALLYRTTADKSVIASESGLIMTHLSDVEEGSEEEEEVNRPFLQLEDTKLKIPERVKDSDAQVDASPSSSPGKGKGDGKGRFSDKGKNDDGIDGNAKLVVAASGVDESIEVEDLRSRTVVGQKTKEEIHDNEKGRKGIVVKGKGGGKWSFKEKGKSQGYWSFDKGNGWMWLEGENRGWYFEGKGRREKYRGDQCYAPPSGYGEDPEKKILEPRMFFDEPADIQLNDEVEFHAAWAADFERKLYPPRNNNGFLDPNNYSSNLLPQTGEDGLPDITTGVPLLGPPERDFNTFTAVKDYLNVKSDSDEEPITIEIDRELIEPQFLAKIDDRTLVKRFLGPHLGSGIVKVKHDGVLKDEVRTECKRVNSRPGMEDAALAKDAIGNKWKKRREERLGTKKEVDANAGKEPKKKSDTPQKLQKKKSAKATFSTKVAVSPAPDRLKKSSKKSASSKERLLVDSDSDAPVLKDSDSDNDNGSDTILVNEPKTSFSSEDDEESDSGPKFVCDSTKMLIKDFVKMNGKGHSKSQSQSDSDSGAEPTSESDASGDNLHALGEELTVEDLDAIAEDKDLLSNAAPLYDWVRRKEYHFPGHEMLFSVRKHKGWRIYFGSLLLKHWKRLRMEQQFKELWTSGPSCKTSLIHNHNSAFNRKATYLHFQSCFRQCGCNDFYFGIQSAQEMAGCRVVKEKIKQKIDSQYNKDQLAEDSQRNVALIPRVGHFKADCLAKPRWEGEYLKNIGRNHARSPFLEPYTVYVSDLEEKFLTDLARNILVEIRAKRNLELMKFEKTGIILRCKAYPELKGRSFVYSPYFGPRKMWNPSEGVDERLDQLLADIGCKHEEVETKANEYAGGVKRAQTASRALHDAFEKDDKALRARGGLRQAELKKILSDKFDKKFEDLNRTEEEAQRDLEKVTKYREAYRQYQDCLKRKRMERGKFESAKIDIQKEWETNRFTRPYVEPYFHGRYLNVKIQPRTPEEQWFFQDKFILMNRADVLLPHEHAPHPDRPSDRDCLIWPNDVQMEDSEKPKEKGTVTATAAAKLTTVAVSDASASNNIPQLLRFQSRKKDGSGVSPYSDTAARTIRQAKIRLMTRDWNKRSIRGAWKRSKSAPESGLELERRQKSMGCGVVVFRLRKEVSKSKNSKLNSSNPGSENSFEKVSEPEIFELKSTPLKVKVPKLSKGAKKHSSSDSSDSDSNGSDSGSVSSSSDEAWYDPLLISTETGTTAETKRGRARSRSRPKSEGKLVHVRSSSYSHLGEVEFSKEFLPINKLCPNCGSTNHFREDECLYTQQPGEIPFWKAFKVCRAVDSIMPRFGEPTSRKHFRILEKVDEAAENDNGNQDVMKTLNQDLDEIAPDHRMMFSHHDLVMNYEKIAGFLKDRPNSGGHGLPPRGGEVRKAFFEAKKLKNPWENTFSNQTRGVDPKTGKPTLSHRDAIRENAKARERLDKQMAIRFDSSSDEDVGVVDEQGKPIAKSAKCVAAAAARKEERRARREAHEADIKRQMKELNMDHLLPEDDEDKQDLDAIELEQEREFIEQEIIGPLRSEEEILKMSKYTYPSAFEEEIQQLKKIDEGQATKSSEVIIPRALRNEEDLLYRLMEEHTQGPDNLELRDRQEAENIDLLLQPMPSTSKGWARRLGGRVPAWHFDDQNSCGLNDKVRVIMELSKRARNGNEYAKQELERFHCRRWLVRPQPAEEEQRYRWWTKKKRQREYRVKQLLALRATRRSKQMSTTVGTKIQKEWKIEDKKDSDSSEGTGSESDDDSEPSDGSDNDSEPADGSDGNASPVVVSPTNSEEKLAPLPLGSNKSDSGSSSDSDSSSSDSSSSSSLSDPDGSSPEILEKVKSAPKTRSRRRAPVKSRLLDTSESDTG